MLYKAAAISVGLFEPIDEAIEGSLEFVGRIVDPCGDLAAHALDKVQANVRERTAGRPVPAAPNVIVSVKVAPDIGPNPHDSRLGNRTSQTSRAVTKHSFFSPVATDDMRKRCRGDRHHTVLGLCESTHWGRQDRSRGQVQDGFTDCIDQETVAKPGKRRRRHFLVDPVILALPNRTIVSGWESLRDAGG